MANPDNRLGTNGAFGGRTSVNALNDDLAKYAGRGILSGWRLYLSSDTATTSTGGDEVYLCVGGEDGIRDVAIAEDNVGNKTTINNRDGEPLVLNMETDIADGSATGNRIDAIVAFVENPPSGNADLLDNPNPVNLLVIQGEPASTAVAPTEDEIRAKITEEGYDGASAYYVTLGTVRIDQGQTTIAEVYQGDGVDIKIRNVTASGDVTFGANGAQLPAGNTVEYAYGQSSSTYKITDGYYTGATTIYQWWGDLTGATSSNAGTTRENIKTATGRIASLHRIPCQGLLNIGDGTADVSNICEVEIDGSWYWSSGTAHNFGLTGLNSGTMYTKSILDSGTSKNSTSLENGDLDFYYGTLFSTNSSCTTLYYHLTARRTNNCWLGAVSVGQRGSGDGWGTITFQAPNINTYTLGTYMRGTGFIQGGATRYTFREHTNVPNTSY